MVVTWWIVAFCAVTPIQAFILHLNSSWSLKCFKCECCVAIVLYFSNFKH